MKSYVIAANFGPKKSPEIWTGGIGHSLEHIHQLWIENLDNFPPGEEPKVVFVGEISVADFVEGNKPKMISWAEVKRRIKGKKK